MTSRVEIIAEAGVNHDGDLGAALALVDAAAEAGADAVKFQTFSARKLASRAAALADYQKAQMGEGVSQYEMLLRLELSEADHHALLDRCRERGVRFLSTPFDIASLEFLTGPLDLSTLKIGSGDLNNGPLLLAAARSGRRLILSTGMASLGQVEIALGLIALGLDPDTPSRPTRDDMIMAWSDPARRARVRDVVTVLHCVSNYPASAESCNLRAMQTMQRAFDVPTGYSDHTLGGTAAILAVGLGAVCVEKHLTLDRKRPGPDHAASSEPEEFGRIVRAIREAEVMLGSPVKACAPEEASTASVARKCIVASEAIRAGDVLGPENVATMRAGQGLDPMAYWEVLGRRARRDFSEGEPIDL